MESNNRSGAQQRRRQREREARERIADAELLAGGFEVGKTRPEVMAQIDALGPPPLEAIGRIAWANGLLAIMAWDAASDPALDPRERRRVVGDLAAKIGITHSKALSEERIKAIEKKVTVGSKAVDGSTDISSGPAIRARGAGVRGRAVSGPMPDLPTAADGGDSPEGGRDVGSPDEDIHG